jgi:ubiquinone biosynthesis accessory factor UbiJ
MNTLETPFASALNHLLEAEPWARERLAPFAAEILELRAPLLPRLRFTIETDGRLAACPRDALSGSEPSLVITLRPEALAAAAKGEEHLLRAIDVAGNAKLASEVMFLARHLRWDVEEDFARFIGDVTAHRLVGAARQAAAWQADALRRVAEGFVEYAAEEKRLLVSKTEIESLAAAQAGLRDGLERLEKRIERLAGVR